VVARDLMPYYNAPSSRIRRAPGVNHLASAPAAQMKDSSRSGTVIAARLQDCVHGPQLRS
jgi:hypothetical protein